MNPCCDKYLQVTIWKKNYWKKIIEKKLLKKKIIKKINTKGI